MLRAVKALLIIAFSILVTRSSVLAVGPDGVWVPGPVTIVRHGPTATYDPLRDRMIVIGGDLASTDVMALSFVDSAATWSVLAVQGAGPSPRYEHTAVYDTWRDRIIVFGGLDANGVRLNDTWALNLSGAPSWQQLATEGGSPPARYAHVAIFRSLTAEMIVHGGETDGPVLTGDVWSLSLSGTPAWAQLSPGGSAPSPRSSHTAVYDDTHDQMVVYGGDTDPGASGDVWTLALSGDITWAHIALAGAPSARYAHTAIWDGYRARMIVFGGGEVVRNDTWELDMSSSPEWHELSPFGPLPESRYTHAAIFDGARDRMVVFGGGNIGDTWFLSWNEFSCKALFAPTYAALSDSVSPPGTPVAYTENDVLVSREPGCSFRLSGESGTFAPWIVGDKVYFDGAPVGGLGFSGTRSQPFQPGTPIQMLLLPAAPRFATNRIGFGPRSLHITLADTERSIYGNSALFLVKDTTPFVSDVSGGPAEPVGAITLIAVPNPSLQGSQILFRSTGRPLQSLIITNLNGQIIRRFQAEALHTQAGSVHWDGCDQDGRPVASGVYFAVAESGRSKVTAKILVSH